MNGLYVVIENEIYLHKEAVGLCPFLSCLDQPTMKYVISVHDYVGSPLRGQPISRRKELAASLFFKEEEDKKGLIQRIETDEKVILAIRELKAIIFDIDRHSYDVLIEKMDRLNLQLAEANTHQEIKNIQLSIELCRKSADELKKKIEQADANIINVELKGGRTLSFLEQWQRNIAYYERLYPKSNKDSARG